MEGQWHGPVLAPLLNLMSTRKEQHLLSCNHQIIELETQVQLKLPLIVQFKYNAVTYPLKNE